MDSDSRNSLTLKEIFSRPVDDKELLKNARKLCGDYLGGVWTDVPFERIRIRVQTGGMNNYIFVVELPDDVQPVGNEPSVVLLRIYFTTNMNHILTESIVFSVLAERNLGPRLLGAFTGGRLEEYIPSRIVTNKEYCNIHVGYEVGRILADVHSVDMPITKQPRLMDIADEMIARLRRAPRWTQIHRMRTTLAKYRPELYPKEITVDLLAEELDVVRRCFEASGSPMVFSNNDLHEGNLLLRDGIKVTDNGLIGREDGVDPLMLIDYEYASYYYRGFDFSHYCCECCQENTNKEWPYYYIMEHQWPDEIHQRRYIDGYLDRAEEITQNNHGKRPQCVSDLPEDREAATQILLTEIRQFVAFPHLFWAIWSFRQAEDFPAEYDFFEYGFDRMALYYYWKPEMLKYLETKKSPN